MFNYFRAISLAMGTLSDLGEAMTPASEEGTNLSQREIVRIAIRTTFRVAKAFGAQLSNADLTDSEFLVTIKEELQRVIIEG